MADASTTLYQFVKPEVGASADTWGGKLNADMDDLDALLGAFTLTGSTSAYVLTTGLSLAAYVSNQRFLVKWNHTNGTTPTLNVDGLGAKNIKKRDASTAPSASDLVSGAFAFVVYDGTNFVLLTPVASDFVAPDATLTALAALSWSSGNALVQFTAADTVSLTLTPSVTSLTVSGIVSAPDGTAAAPAIKVGDEQNGLYSPAANQVALALGGTAYVTFSTTSTNFASQTRIILGAGSAASPPLVIRAADTGTGFYSIGTDNWGFSVAGTKRIDISASLVDFSSTGVRGRVALSSETTTPTSASANKKMALTGGATINTGTADDFYLLDPGTSARTITRGAGMTMYVNGTDSATATLAANQMGVVHYRSASVVVLTGAFT